MRKFSFEALNSTHSVHLEQLDVYEMKNVPFIQKYIKAIFEPENSNKQDRMLFYILKDDVNIADYKPHSIGHIVIDSTFEENMVSFLEHYNIFFPCRNINVADFDEAPHTGKEKLVYREDKFLEKDLLKLSEDLKFFCEYENTNNDPNFVFGDVAYLYPTEKIIEYINIVAEQKNQLEVRPANIYFAYPVNYQGKQETVEKGLLKSNGTTAYFKTAMEKLKKKERRKSSSYHQ